MATKSSIFELNGKAYDALTGAMLGNAKRVEDTVYVHSVKVQPVPRQRGVSMDGMIAGPNHTAKHVKHHRQQPAKTLMRHAVKPPQPAQLSKLRPGSAQASLQPADPAASASITPKLSSAYIDPVRAHRARTASRSQAVQHFRPQRQTASLDFRRPRPQPAAFTPPSVHPTPAAQPRPMARQHDEAAYERDLFSEAIAQATSHEEPAPKESLLNTAKRRGKKRKQVLSIVGSLAIFAILVGVIAYQNKASIELQIASAKAGFSAAAPLYKPDGYKLDKMTYGSGSVAQLYRNDTAQSFTVTQKKSNWDSQTLLDNFVATSNQEYQGYQSNGRTIYVYGKGNATWVNGGVWYQIKSDSSMPAEQLVKVASSI